MNGLFKVTSKHLNQIQSPKEQMRNKVTDVYQPGKRYKDNIRLWGCGEPQ